MMKLSTPLLMAVFLFASFQADAQRNQRDRDDRSFGEKLWYGGSIFLSYSSGNSRFSDYSTFQAGLGPMVGYKLSDEFSVGPRVEALYTYYKIRTAGDSYTVDPLTLKGAIFTRYKFIPQIFGHAELGLSRYTFPLQGPGGFIIEDGEVATSTETYTDFLIGAGYTSGGKVAGEFSVLYNLLEPADSFNTPFYIRAGINVNF